MQFVRKRDDADKHGDDDDAATAFVVSLPPPFEPFQAIGAFIPYASGPRGCVGRPFARVALRILLARICVALDFSPALPTPPAAHPYGENPVEVSRGCTTAQNLVRVVSRDNAATDAVQSAGGVEGGVAAWDGKEKGRYEPPQPGWGGGHKEMQAGFTVLPGDGVHLRLMKWTDDDG